MKAVKFENEENLIKDFLSLPVRLYRKYTNMENPSEIRSLLLGTHVLSKYFSLEKWVVYDDQNKVVARFAITEYPNDPCAYLGFYECINNDEAAKCVFDTAYEYCKAKGFASICGPVDASFWIKYRLKINKYHVPPYTGEPFNREYYFRQFRQNGFRVSDHYTSQALNPMTCQLPKYLGRLEAFTKKGYEIRSPRLDEFDKVIGEIYDLLIELYSDFPIFKPISKEDFLTVFSGYRSIINMQMVKMAYYEGKAVGFYVSLPNYGNLVYHTDSLMNLLNILCLRRKPKEYIMLYMGVDQNHRGLGKAICGSVIDELVELGVPSIGALERDGKITQTYGLEWLDSRYEYVLLSKQL